MTNVNSLMQFAVIVNSGFEKVAVKQIKEFTSSKDITVNESIVLFSLKNDSSNSAIQEISKFIYLSQISVRVLLLIGQTELKNSPGINQNEFSEELLEYSKLVDLSFIKHQYERGIKEFRVKIESNSHMDNSEIEKEIGSIILEKYPFTVNLKHPQLQLHVFIQNNSSYFGIDLSGDLSKRDYRIFNNAVSIKGTTAFGLLMLAGYNPEISYLNPICYSGTIEIEAALYSCKKSHRFYNKSFPINKFFDENIEKVFELLDKKINVESYPIIGSDSLLSSVTAAVKNAKIAGLDKCIDFKRMDLDFLDVKYEEKTFDKIITFTPGSSKHKDMQKILKELFYQAEYILRDDGSMTIMCLSKDLLIEISKQYLELKEETVVESGSQTLYVLTFKKSNELSKELKRLAKEKEDLEDK